MDFPKLLTTTCNRCVCCKVTEPMQNFVITEKLPEIKRVSVPPQVWLPRNCINLPGYSKYIVCNKLPGVEKY